ncbi:MAG: putative aminohydrolase SsnA [Anaerolineaceae bacterium]|nr:putative aminohydrolase SsnA [Anaerolineaceae bacterium]
MLITNAKIVTWEQPNRILNGQAVFITDGKITEIGDQKQMRDEHPDAEILDAGGQYLMPGLICSHTHFYGAFSRGLAIPTDPPDSFPQILEKLWWPLDKSLTLEDVRYCALVCMVDAIKHGTTTLFDHHASPNAIEGSLDVIADAALQTGVRASLCYEVTDRNGEAQAYEGIRENLRFIERVKRDNDGGKLAATFGLHASLTLTDKTLEESRKAIPEGAGFHIHIAEHPADEYDSMGKTGMRVVDRLKAHDILGPRSIAVHCVHIDAREIAELAETKTWVSHQPRSNMNNAVGLPRVEEMLRFGIPVVLGNDGFSNTMWEEWKTAYLAHKLVHLDPRRMNGMDIVEMGVYNNAALANSFFDHAGVGCVEAGKEADLILVDYHPITEMNEGNLPWHILFGFYESMVTTTIVQGKVLMKDRKLVGLDEKEIAENATRVSRDVWKRYRTLF